MQGCSAVPNGQPPGRKTWHARVDAITVRQDRTLPSNPDNVTIMVHHIIANQPIGRETVGSKRACQLRRPGAS